MLANTKIAGKLMVGFGSIMAIFIAFAAIVIVNITKIDEMTNISNTQNLGKLTSSSTIVRELNDLVHAYNRISNGSDVAIERDKISSRKSVVAASISESSVRAFAEASVAVWRSWVAVSNSNVAVVSWSLNTSLRVAAVS